MRIRPGAWCSGRSSRCSMTRTRWRTSTEKTRTRRRARRAATTKTTRMTRGARRGRKRASPWTHTIPRTSPCARTTGKTRGGTVPAWPARSSSGYPRGRPPQICPRRARRWPVKAWTRRGPAPSDRPGHSGPSLGATTHRPTTVAGGGRRAGRLCLIAHTHSPRSASLTRIRICQTRGKTLGRDEAGRRVSGRRRCGGTATRTQTRKPRDSGGLKDTRVGVKRTPHPVLILPIGAKVLKS